MSLGTMTRSHDRWNEFLNRMKGPEGCNFRMNASMEEVWTCAGGRDKTLAIKILTAMGATVADVVNSCIYFEAHGGFCDCEIIFNVATSSGHRTPPRVRKPGSVRMSKPRPNPR